VKVTNNGCKYKFTLKEKVAEGNYKAEVDVVCPAGKPGIQFHVYTSHANLTGGSAACALTVPPQTGLKSVTLTNNSGDIVVDTGTVEGAKIKIHRINALLCPSSGTENETTTGVYHIGEPVTVSGSSGEEEVEIDMAGG
jgi:hypothetical protein